MKEKSPLNTLLLTFIIMNFLIIVSYGVTWQKEYSSLVFHLGENWQWGKIVGNSGPWQGSGFDEAFGYFLFVPIITSFGSFILLQKNTKVALANCFLSFILFVVSIEHMWLID